MMKNFLVSLAFLMSAFNANAALLDGKTINYQFYYPNSSTTPSWYDSGNKLVGAGVEVNATIGASYTIDISDTNLLVDFSNSGTWLSAAFSGFKITDVFNSIVDFSGVSINAATNMAGLTLDRITVLNNAIWVNWQGLSFTESTIVSLDITPSAVPVPAALFMFAPALLGFIGFRRKAKNLAA